MLQRNKSHQTRFLHRTTASNDMNYESCTGTEHCENFCVCVCVVVIIIGNCYAMLFRYALGPLGRDSGAVKGRG